MINTHRFNGELKALAAYALAHSDIGHHAPVRTKPNHNEDVAAKLREERKSRKLAAYEKRNPKERIARLRATFERHTQETMVSCTCFHCSAQETCDCAYDSYNTNGDCLADK